MANPYGLRLDDGTDYETDDGPPQTPDDYYGRTEAEKKRTPVSLPAPSGGLAQNPWVHGQEGAPQPAAQHGLFHQAGVQPQGMGQQQPPPRVPVPQPPPEVPFTQADNLQLQRLQQSQSTVQQQLESGQIDQNTADDYHRQINGRLGPLQAKQKAQQQKQQQEQQQQMMQQTALAESMQSAHRQTRAKSFPSEVATYTDPVTGATMHMIQDHKGDWKEATFGRHQAEQEMVLSRGEAQPDMVYAAGTPEPARGSRGGGPGFQHEPPDSPTPELSPAPEPQPGRSTGEELEGQDQIAQTFESAEKLLEQSKQTGQPVPIEQLGQSLRQQPTQGNLKSDTTPPKILNQFGEEIGSPGATRRGQRDQWGRPTGEQPGEDPATSQAAISELYRRADSSIPRLPDNASPAMQLHRAEQVNSLVDKMMTHRLSMANHSEQRKTAAQEHIRKEASLEKEHIRQEQFKSQQQEERLQAQKDAREEKKKQNDELRAKQKLELIHSHMKDIDKQYNSDEVKKIPLGGELPEHQKYLKNDQTRYDEAVRRAERDMQEIGVIGKPAKAEEDATKKRREDQSKALQALHQKISSQSAAGEPVDSGPERVGELLKGLEPHQKRADQAALAGVPFSGVEPDPKAGDDRYALAVHSARLPLMRAAHEKRGLTPQEEAVYQKTHAALAALHKERGLPDLDALKLRRKE